MRDEDALIAWLRDQLGEDGAWIGDDATSLPDGAWIATVDSQIAGTHFPPALDPAVMARRLLAVNVSDLAAMGARPRWGLLTVAAPGDFPHRRFFRSFLRSARHVGMRLVGGDLARQAHPAATLTLLGEAFEAGRSLRRDTAQPGEVIWLGGTVGVSHLGQQLLATVDAKDWAATATWHDMTRWLDDDVFQERRVIEAPRTLWPSIRRALVRHLLPRPQLRLSAWLIEHGGHTAIDVSDGVARDLHRLCRKSEVGARLFDDAPLFPAWARPLAEHLGIRPDLAAWTGGEDYVLLFTLPEGVRPPIGCVAIGEITAHRGELAFADGTPLAAAGWDHLDDGPG
ncbi:MAG: thiamine-phosphate kinase [Acidobacteriota bacterium]